MIARLRALDLAAYRVLRTAGHGPAAETAVRRFSALGEHAAVWLALGLAGMVVDAGRRDPWRRGCLTVAGAYALNTGVKLLVRRRRPRIAELPALTSTPTSLSFPSAHATSGFAAARVYSGLVPAGPLYALAAGLGASRVYLGVHYPSDVLAGALLGAALGGLAR